MCFSQHLLPNIVTNLKGNVCIQIIFRLYLNLTYFFTRHFGGQVLLFYFHENLQFWCLSPSKYLISQMISFQINPTCIFICAIYSTEWRCIYNYLYNIHSLNLPPSWVYSSRSPDIGFFFFLTELLFVSTFSVSNLISQSNVFICLFKQVLLNICIKNNDFLPVHSIM